MNDRHLEWKRKRRFYTAHDLLALIGTTATDVSVETAGVTQLEVKTNAGFAGSDFLAGEFITGFMPIPYDLDPKFPVYFRVHFSATNDGSTAQGVTWILLASAVAVDGVFTNGGPSAALDTAIPERNAITSLALSVTDWGKKNSIGLGNKQIEDGAGLHIKLECDVIDFSGTGITFPIFLGLEIGYTPLMCVGVGKETESPERMY